MHDHKKLILLVDDFKDNREMYAHFLSQKGFRVALASDGQEGMGKAHELLPDLIIMDLSLPVISGWEASRRLKADEQTKHIPIILLTAHSFDGPTVLKAGFEGLLTKPCMPDAMVTEITRILDEHAQK